MPSLSPTMEQVSSAGCALCAQPFAIWVCDSNMHAAVHANTVATRIVATRSR